MCYLCFHASIVEREENESEIYSNTLYEVKEKGSRNYFKKFFNTFRVYLRVSILRKIDLQISISRLFEFITHTYNSLSAIESLERHSVSKTIEIAKCCKIIRHGQGCLTRNQSTDKPRKRERERERQKLKAHRTVAKDRVPQSKNPRQTTDPEATFRR